MASAIGVDPKRLIRPVGAEYRHSLPYGISKYDVYYINKQVL